jgi:Mrp family chromosome partitioning ATPase
MQPETASAPRSVQLHPAQFQPSILSAAWRYRWIVLAAVVLALAVGLYQSSTQTITYAATAQLVINPATTVVSEERAVSPDRYISVQVVVLRSPKVAEQAVEIATAEAAESNLDWDPTVDELLANSEIIAAAGSDLVQVRYVATTPQQAVIGANSLAVAYQDVRRSEAVAAGEAAIARVDALLESVNEDIAATQAEIDLLRNQGTQQDPVLDALEAQLASSLATLDDLYEELAATEDDEVAAGIRQRISDIAQQISLTQAVRGLTQESPDFEAQLQIQATAIERRAQLSERRDTLSVDTELLGSGVSSYLPATQAASSGNVNIVRTLIVMAAFGVLIGSAVAYFLATRRRTFSHRAEPEAILQAPLLADVPDFGEERLKGLLPVRTDPRSVTAESFRFALAALDIQLGNLDAKSAAFVSAGIGAGKTAVTVNIALAAVRQGYQVLVVDADFGNQALTNLIDPFQQAPLGLTDVVSGAESLDMVIRSVPLGDAALRLLSRGRNRMTAVDFFRSEAGFELFEQLTDRFDLVLIDSPPMLQIAYGALLARHADALVPVISHGDPIADAEDLVERLRLVGKPIAGYVYNRAPLRQELTVAEGSLQELTGPVLTARRERRAVKKG